MYSRNYSSNTYYNPSDSFTDLSIDKREVIAKNNVPVKSFPQAGAFEHFEKEYGNRNTNQEQENKIQPTDEVAERIQTEQTSSKIEENDSFSSNDGLASRLKKNIARYTKGLFGSFGFDDFLLIALLLLFLTDDSSENDSLIPIILVALILF